MGVQTAIGLHVMLDGYTTSYIRALAVNSSVSHSQYINPLRNQPSLHVLFLMVLKNLKLGPGVQS